MRRLLLPALVALLVPAAPAAAGWSADRTQTRAGTASGVRAAGASGDRIALTWARRSGSTQRAEVRLGRARSGLAGASIVLDSQAGQLVGAPLALFAGDAKLELAWRRRKAGTTRLRHRTVSSGRRLGASVELTTTGQSAFEPAWVPGPVPVLLWSRTTRADAIELTPTGPRGVRLPSPPRSEPGAATDQDGLATLAWVNEGRVLVSDRRPDGFSPPAVLATGSEVNRAAVLRTRGGGTLVFWRDGQALVVAARPAGGTYGLPRTVLEQTTDAAQLAQTSTGEVLVVAPTGDASFVGQLQLARLDAGGVPLGPVQVLGNGRRAQLAADGTGSAFVAWMSEGAERTVRVRRIAAGGLLGPARVLAARTDPTSSPALAATREGGAVAAWVAGGDVHARTYVP